MGYMSRIFNSSISEIQRNEQLKYCQLVKLNT